MVLKIGCGLIFNFAKMKKIEIIEKKFFTSETIKTTLALWRFHSQKIVFTNGCFDLLHQGHIHLLTSAADFGNKLIVGLNSDNSVRRLKGNHRPFQNEKTRMLLLASLHFVDAVILFDEDTPYELLQFIQPDVLVKGGDYKNNEIVGADIVKQVEIVHLLEGFSTTSIEEKLKQR